MISSVLTFTTLLVLISCSSTPNYIKKPQVGDAEDVIELENPFQDDLDRELSTTKKMSAHTVYDSEDKIANYKESKTNQIVESLAGPFKFYQAKSKKSLGVIAQEIYGDRHQWKKLYRWNMDTLQGIRPVKVGEKIKYLPPTITQTRSTQTNRKPASVDEFKTYTVRPNENLGSIAGKLLGDRKKWKQLRDWNKDVLPDPHNLEKGTQLKYRAPASNKP